MSAEKTIAAFEEWKAERRYNLEPRDYDEWVDEQKELALLRDLRELVENPDVTLEDVKACLTHLKS